MWSTDLVFCDTHYDFQKTLQMNQEILLYIIIKCRNIAPL